MEKYIKNHRLSLIFAILTFGVMVLIFFFSHQAGDESSSTSSGITHFIVRLFYKDFNELSAALQIEILSKYSFFIRKAAHFSIFAVLGIFSNLSIRFFYREKGVSLPRFSLVFNALFCFIYACSDELHQLFVRGRVGSFTDVLIDFSGSITAILILALIFQTLNKRSKTYAKKK